MNDISMKVNGSISVVRNGGDNSSVHHPCVDDEMCECLTQGLVNSQRSLLEQHSVGNTCEKGPKLCTVQGPDTSSYEVLMNLSDPCQTGRYTQDVYHQPRPPDGAEIELMGLREMLVGSEVFHQPRPPDVV